MNRTQLEDRLTAYLELRKALGTSVGANAKLLGEFVQVAGDQSTTDCVTSKVVFDWLENKKSEQWIAAETGIEGIDFRACRRTCATHLSKHGGIKEVQAHLRHSRATTTLDVYIQEIPEAVREAVEGLDSVFAATKTDTEANKSK